jgi:ABC-type transport system involved in multi-copper enzyme maturation permease subunit
MVGPVFVLELIRSSRRGGQHRFRWAYAGWLLLQFGIFAYVLFVTYIFQPLFHPATRWRPSPADAGNLASTFLTVFVVQQFLVFLLAGPAFAAGTITEEKMRRTLEHLLTTGLSAWEIVAGKLLASVVRVFDLSLPGWLMLAFLAGVCGLDPLLLLALVGGTLAPLLALAAAGILASVWCRHTTSAVFTAYLLAAAGFGLLCTLGLFVPPLHPVRVASLLVGQGNPGDLLQGLLASSAGWGCLALAWLILAALRLRPAYLRQIGAPERPRRVWAPRPKPPVSDQPVRWRACYRAQYGHRPVLRWGGFVCIGAVFLMLSTLSLLAAWNGGGGWFAPVSLLMVFVCSLATAIDTSAAITKERERQTWEALLLTPLDAKQLIRAKVWGILDAGRSFLLAFVLPPLVLSLAAGPLAIAWVVVGFVMTWVMMYYFGACGVRCSVKATTSWKSLVATFGIGYRDLFIRFLVFGLPVGSIVGAFASAAFVAWGWQGLAVAGWVLSITCWSILLMTGVMIFARTEQLFQEAERWLAQNERIPHYPRYQPKALAAREPVSIR